MAGGEQLARVVAQQARERGLRGEIHAVLVRAQHLRALGVEAAEVERPQRAVAGAVGAGPAAQRAVREVPIREVAAGVRHDVARHEAGGEVEPALVGEQAARRVDRAVLGEPLRPPGQEALGVRVAPGGEEAGVEGAREQDLLLRRAAPVARQRAVEVAGEHEPVRPRSGQDAVERRVDARVGVEVEHGRAALERVAQQPRLERAGELERAVGGAQLREPGHAELLRARARRTARPPGCRR